jgi:hypothetical protein
MLPDIIVLPSNNIETDHEIRGRLEEDHGDPFGGILTACYSPFASAR